jgi:hypothetical protein
LNPRTGLAAYILSLSALNMPFNSVPEPFEGFKRLGKSSYIYEPHSPKKSAESTPDVVLFCSWLDALPKHIAKYTEGYKVLYPNARILLVTTSFVEMTFHSLKSEAARVEPALEVILAGPSDEKILLAFSSNGGAYTSSYIAREYKARTGRPLPLGAQIQDSSPGRWNYGRTLNALLVSLPRQFVLRWLGYLFLHAFLCWYVISGRIRGKEDFFTILRGQLNDKTLFNQRAPRLYFYSHEDSMVSWEDIEVHSKEAEAKGYKVTTEEFVGSPHCGHLTKDPVRYWGAVKAVWESGSF